ncbi:MAG: UvrB/UvrC motif-containing protein [Clostridia bacterium]|nr:UvrB/UvrC motif-containing protein [Clostridia bacterium]
MLCEKCGVNNATTHIRTVVKGVVCDKYLCFSCATSEGFKSKELSQIMSALLGEESNNQNSKIARCACCGSTVAEIAKSGKCGCSECYNTFYDQLLPYLKKSQFGKTRHDGKLIQKIKRIQQSKEEEIEELKYLLKKSVLEENYEKAAVIRDKIKELKEET